MPAALTMPGFGPVHHRAYLVESIEDTVTRLVEQFGAGPFFALENVPMENVTRRGEVAEFSHNSAFGQLGGDPIELMDIDQLSPARVAERFLGPRPRLHHIAWAVPPSSVEQVREALETHGAPAYLRANLDDIDLTLHDSSAALGHDVEIHADVEGLQGFLHDGPRGRRELGWLGSNPPGSQLSRPGRGGRDRPCGRLSDGNSDGLDQCDGGGRVWRLAVGHGVDLAWEVGELGGVDVGEALGVERKSGQDRHAYVWKLEVRAR
jgi:hypothetical protein